MNKKLDKNAIIREHSMIAAIISDNFMKPLYECTKDGYLEAVSAIADATEKLYVKFYPKDMEPDWDLYLSENSPHGYVCWDDLIIGEGEKIIKLDYPGLKPPVPDPPIPGKEQENEQ